MKTFAIKKQGSVRYIEFDVTADGFLKMRDGRYAVNSFLLEKNGMTKDEATTIIQKDDAAVLGHPILSKCLCRIGENEGGLLIEDQEEKERREKKEMQERIAKGEQAVTVGVGYFGITIRERLDDKTWNIVRPYATYVEGNDGDLEYLDDMGYYWVKKEDIRGWYYKGEAIDALNEAGIKTAYLGVTVKSYDELSSVRQKHIIEEKRAAEEERAEAAKRKIILSKFNSLCKIYCSEEDVAKVDGLEKILIPALRFDGDDIYGGGRWLMQDDDYIYLVQNNGHDGDDWSLNNFPTGGAGAILYKIEKNAEALSIFKAMLAYLPEKEEHDPLKECMEYFKSHGVLHPELDLSSCMGSYRDRALYVKIKDNFFLGITPEKDKVIYLAARMNFFESDLRYFEGNHFAALAFAFNESIYGQWLAALPEWAMKAWNKESICRGRFFVGNFRNIYPDNNYALYGCYKHDYAITSVDYSRDVEFVSFESLRSSYLDGVSIWSDGRVISKGMICFNITGGKRNYEDVDWLLPFVYDYHKNAAPIPETARKLLRADCYGFDKIALVNAVSYSYVSTIMENENISIGSVEIGFSDGIVKTFYEINGAFACFDDVTEIFKLYSDREKAMETYREWAK